jgi:type I restriction enzyme R subunit
MTKVPAVHEVRNTPPTASSLDGKTLTANQIEFVDLVIDHLPRHGWIEPSQLYESLFIDLHPCGVDGVFSDQEVRAMLSILTAVKQNAEGLRE